MDTQKLRVWYKKESVQKYGKIYTRRKKLLEKNPNIQAVLSNQVLYSKDFKEKAITEYANGKSANQIFLEAGIPTEIISKQHDYPSKTISKCRNANRQNLNIHCSNKKNKHKKSAYQKLIEKNKYLEAENEFLKKLSALCKSYKA